jgi:hypothetical protein
MLCADEDTPGRKGSDFVSGVLIIHNVRYCSVCEATADISKIDAKPIADFHLRMSSMKGLTKRASTVKVFGASLLPVGGFLFLLLKLA